MSIYILSSSFETFIVTQWLKNNKCLIGEVDSHHSVSCHTALSEKRFMGKENGIKYEGWNFNSGNYLFTTDTK